MSILLLCKVLSRSHFTLIHTYFVLLLNNLAAIVYMIDGLLSHRLLLLFPYIYFTLLFFYVIMIICICIFPPVILTGVASHNSPSTFYFILSWCSLPRVPTLSFLSSRTRSNYISNYSFSSLFTHMIYNRVPNSYCY